MKSVIKNRYSILIIFFIVILFSCKKYVDVGAPVTQIDNQNIFSGDAVAQGAMTGVYSRMSSSSYFASGSTFGITHLAGILSDEMTLHASDAGRNEFYNNSVSPGSTINYSNWKDMYQFVYSANSIIEGIAASTEVSEPIKRQLKGEAKFIRAFCNFYLVNLYGEIPIITVTDYRENRLAFRSSIADVYDSIISDLKEAKELMAADYSFSAGERTRPNKWTAAALLARIYLYSQNWAAAETEATAVINDAQYSLIPPNEVFLKNSNEAIWQLAPVSSNINTHEGLTMILTGNPAVVGQGQVSLTSNLVNSFAANDARRINWIDSVIPGSNKFYYCYKYKIASSPVVTEYSVIFRLAEQYIIRAEARMQQNKLSDAVDDINVIRSRAGLNDVNTVTPEIIEEERRHEFFTEWGHRWFDLNRWPAIDLPDATRADEILGAVKSQWQRHDKFLPIPLKERKSNRNLTQNGGYL